MADSYTTPIAAGQLKKGMHAILKGRPCKIIEMSVSKTGKHGHAKAHFIGTDVFTGKKYEEVCPTTHTMQQPVLERTEYALMDIEDDYYSLLTATGEIKGDLRISDSDIDKQVQEQFENGDEITVCVLSWGEEEAIISFKVDK